MVTRRKVVCVWGKFDDTSDFVLEPAGRFEENEDCFWIEEVKE